MPELTGPVALAVLFGALLHASWNALIKSGRDKALDTALVHAIGSLLALPLLLSTGFATASAWPYLIGSWLLHLGYYFALVNAYKHGDLGLAYPLMRGTAPLLVALASVAFIGEHLTHGAWLGVLGISAGVLTLGLAPGRMRGHDPHRRATVMFALGNAAIIATYTVVDGIGVRTSGNALAYVATLFAFDGIPYLALLLWQRGAQRPAAIAYMASRWKIATLGALASLGSYGIALWAMAHAPVAVVAAMRESSVLFAALIGLWLLREPFGWQRVAGTLTIVVGVMTLRFG